MYLTIVIFHHIKICNLPRICEDLRVPWTIQFRYLTKYLRTIISTIQAIFQGVTRISLNRTGQCIRKKKSCIIRKIIEPESGSEHSMLLFSKNICFVLHTFIAQNTYCGNSGCYCNKKVGNWR